MKEYDYLVVTVRDYLAQYLLMKQIKGVKKF